MALTNEDIDDYVEMAVKLVPKETAACCKFLGITNSEVEPDGKHRNKD